MTGIRSPVTVRTFCSSCPSTGMYRLPTVSPVSPNPSRRRPASVNSSFQVMMRGSNVTRRMPRAGTSVRSTA